MWWLVGVKRCTQVCSQHKLVGFWGLWEAPQEGFYPPWMMQSSHQPEAWHQPRGPYILLPSVAGGKQEAARVEKFLAVRCCREWMAGNAWGTPRQRCQVPRGWMRGLGAGRALPALPPGAGRWRCAPGADPGALPAGKAPRPSAARDALRALRRPGRRCLEAFPPPPALRGFGFASRSWEGP